MAAIKKDQYAGGRRLSRGGARPGADLAATLRDAAADLAGIRPATIVAANATDLATAITLANELKTAINAARAYTLKTTAP